MRYYEAEVSSGRLAQALGVMLTVLRWLCVPPAALAAWYLALILALLLHTAVEGFCPPDQVVSGACFAPWFLRFSDVLVCFGAALAASLIVLAAFLVAPSHRFHVAWATFIVGACVALWFAALLGTWAECASALAAGALAAYLLTRKSMPPNHSLNPTAAE